MNTHSQDQELNKEWIMLSRKLLPLLFASFIFSGELDVEGNLNVSGTIQSQTIDSLLQVIAELQAQIALLQQGAENKLETRVFTLESPFMSLENTGDYYEIDLFELTGQQLSRATVSIIELKNISDLFYSYIDMLIYHMPTSDAVNGARQRIAVIGETVNYNSPTSSGINNSLTIINNGDYLLRLSAPDVIENNIDFDIVLAITAQFPE